MADRETVVEMELIEKPKSLFTGRIPVKEITIEVVTGTGIFKRGTVMAIEDSSGKVKAYNPSGSGGEEKARYILASEELDFSIDKYAVVYDMGDFYYGGIIFPDGINESQVTQAIKELEQHKIYITEGDSKWETK